MTLDGARHVELGPGLRLVQLRVAPSDVVVLRGILAGYDGVASVHGDETGVVALLATDGTIDEVNEIVSDLARSVAVERIA
jgi:hypothetical protein